MKRAAALSSCLTALIVASGLSVGYPAHAASMDWSCYGRFAKVLKQRDFPGADCARSKVDIQFLGATPQGKDRYLVYQYAYEDDPRKIGGVQAHALKRILIFKNSIANYLGGYVMDAGFKAKLEGNRIRVLTDRPNEDGTIEIGPAGPPETAFYGGDMQSFDR